MQYQASAKVSLATATSAADKAFGAWQKVTCPATGSAPAIKLGRVYGTVACNLHEYNQVDGNANIIMFHDDQWPYSDGTDVLALTTVTFSKKTGDIYDADMEINGEQPLSTTDIVDPNAYDLQSIITHEAGHFLGLGHSLDPDATMWAQYSTGNDSFRDLSPDDVDAICTVYPPATAKVCDYSPRQGFSPQCGIYPSGNGSCAIARGAFGGHPRSSAVEVLFALAAPAILRARGRRKSASSADA
jgi:hypothetical protein